MTIDLNGANRIFNFTSFNVNGASVVFTDSMALSTPLSVINSITNASTINGALTAPSNISVWLIDPQGITFGPVARSAAAASC